MAQRTAPLHLRCAESSTAAGSPIAAINAHSGRGVVRPLRFVPHHVGLWGVLFFVFAGPVACSSRQRPRCAQPLARRRMAAQRFCRLLTLPDLISAISEPVLRSVFGFAAAPLRGSWRQQPRGAAVPAAKVAPCADDVLGAAVLDRGPLPCGSGVGVVVGSCWQKCHHITPPTLAPSRQQSLRSATAHSPHENQQSIAAILAVIAPKIF
jgi:hypothetical protein